MNFTAKLYVMMIPIYTLGGTIDKVYFDQKSEFQVGEPQIREILKDANVSFEYKLRSLFVKDSLDMTDEDREFLVRTIQADPESRILITHGTDTMVQTAKALKAIVNKTIVLTGAMHPAMFKKTDAPFNIGCAVTAVQILPPGVYIVMNGVVFNPEQVQKNIAANCFEPL